MNNERIAIRRIWLKMIGLTIDEIESDIQNYPPLDFQEETANLLAIHIIKTGKYE